jgi:hypothetical protein
MEDLLESVSRANTIRFHEEYNFLKSMRKMKRKLQQDPGH